MSGRGYARFCDPTAGAAIAKLDADQTRPPQPAVRPLTKLERQQIRAHLDAQARKALES